MEINQELIFKMLDDEGIERDILVILKNNRIIDITPKDTKIEESFEHIKKLLTGEIMFLKSENKVDFINLYLKIKSKEFNGFWFTYGEWLEYSKKKRRLIVERGVTEIIGSNIEVNDIDKVLVEEELLKELKRFSQKDGLSFGITIVQIKKLYKGGYLNDISDFFTLKSNKEKIISDGVLTEKALEKLIVKIDESIEQKYIQNFISALGIEKIGEVNAKIIAKKIKNIDELLEKSKDLNTLYRKNGLGEVIPYHFFLYFQNKRNREKVIRIKELGINFERKKKSRKYYIDGFKGKRFACTGKLSHFSRKEIEDEIEKVGGINTKTVNSYLDFLIIGENAGSKLKKAEAIDGVQILTEEEFLEVVKG